jgi:hypothetical protein
VLEPGGLNVVADLLAMTGAVISPAAREPAHLRIEISIGPPC